MGKNSPAGDAFGIAPSAPLTLAGIISLLYTAYIVAIGGDWSVGRFFVPVLPFGLIVAASGAFVPMQGLVRRVLRRRAS